MSNIAGKAYAMNVITPSDPGIRFRAVPPYIRVRPTWINKLIFMVSRCLPETLQGLLGLSLIHFARWFFVKPDQWPVFDEKLKARKQNIKQDYMIFCSNFNGTWDQYIDAFSDGIPNGLDLFWYTAVKYPQSIPIIQFKNYITHNQIDTNYYYNATPGAAQRDVKAGLKVRRAILKLKEVYESGADPAQFAKAYRKHLIEVQSFLGDPGFAPVASLSTEIADLNRMEQVKAMAREFEKENQSRQAEMQRQEG